MLYGFQAEKMGSYLNVAEEISLSVNATNGDCSRWVEVSDGSMMFKLR